MNRDFIFASITLALAVAYYLVADAIPTSLLSDAVGPGGLPKAYALIMAGLSLIMMVQSLARQRRLAARRRTASGEDSETVRLNWSQIYRAVGLLAIGAFYVFTVPWLGYIPTLALLIAGTAYYQGGSLGRATALIAVLGALFFWVLFVLVLHIPQPPGIWPNLF